MQWIEKYTELKMIQEFLLSNDPKVFAKLRPIQNEQEDILSFLAEESGRSSPIFDEDVEMTNVSVQPELECGFFENTP